jgi:hypothetical protein
VHWPLCLSWRGVCRPEVWRRRCVCVCTWESEGTRVSAGPQLLLSARFDMVSRERQRAGEWSC